ncbi:MAG: sigma-54 dependent transcriptional regulator [bacterium]|nr:sigma-54 dependent transcriptional regulator [bacterium]
MTSSLSPQAAKDALETVHQHPQSPVVLVVDDEPAICWAMERSLTREGYRVAVASSAEDGLQIAAEQAPSLVFLDVRLPREDGLSALPKFKALAADTPIIVMTAFGDLQTAVDAVAQGAADYLTKPFKLEDITRVCHMNLPAVRQPASPHTTVSVSDEDAPKIVGRSAAMQHVFRQIAFFASSDLSVLITGETGTGKELVAAAIHRHSQRRHKPYLAVAPVAMNSELIESELFGHARGAFTGAETDRLGLFEAAQGGTILLDEIGDLAANLQVKLLRVLEQGEFCRVGETKPRPCDVRILASTNCDLEQSVAAGHFREDLYYRLNGMHIHLPPLRERSEDLLPLCEHFLRPLGRSVSEIVNDTLLASLAERPWPGNVREFKNAIQHAAVLARGRPLQLSDFPSGRTSGIPSNSLQHAVLLWAEQHLASPEEPNSDLLSALMSAVEPTLLSFAIASCDGNRAKAAELLGIHRGTLRERLKNYGLDP